MPPKRDRSNTRNSRLPLALVDRLERLKKLERWPVSVTRVWMIEQLVTRRLRELGDFGEPDSPKVGAPTPPNRPPDSSAAIPARAPGRSWPGAAAARD